MRFRKDTWDPEIIKSVLIRNEYNLPAKMDGMVVLDIGAHIGSFAIACQKRNAKKVVSFEPDPENFHLLNVNTNQDKNSKTEMHVAEAAVIGGESCNNLGVRHLTEHDFDKGRNTGHVDIYGEPSNIRGINFNEALQMAGGKVDFLKLDCEGAEWGIFETGDFSKIRYIAAELHAVPDSPHPSLDKFRGKSLTDLSTEVETKLQELGFETSVVFTDPSLAKLSATKITDVPLGKRRRLLWIGDAQMHTGYARVTEQICRRLVGLGWDVRVLGVGYNGDPHNKPYKIYPALDVQTGSVNGEGRVREIIQRTEPDICIIQDDSWNVGHMLDAMAMQNVLVPTIGYIAIDSENVRQNVVLQLRNLKHTICHTQYGVEQLQLAGFTGPTSVAAHGVDTNLYCQYERKGTRDGLPITNPDDAFIWGAVAMNQPRKALDLTIAYWAAWWKAAGKPDNAYLYLHTNNNGSWDLQQLVSYHDIRGRLIGSETGSQALTEQQMPTLYSAFDVMISTAEGESFGLPLLEGMACGIPQIAVKCGGAPSWAGDSIYWVKPSFYRFTSNRTNTKRWIASEIDFVTAMNDMYNNAELREDYSKRGLEMAKAMSWDGIAKHFDNVAKQILQTRQLSAHSTEALMAEF